MSTNHNTIVPGRPGRRLALTLALILCGPLSGCAALTNPAVDGVTVRRLPPELQGESRAGFQTIPLSLLGQKPPEVYRLAPGDVLGIWIEGVLGERHQPIPAQGAERAGATPATGYPIPVRDDGTISLPLTRPIKVQGMSLTEAEEAIRKAYTVDKEILKPGEERIVVTLQHPRQYHVLVIREDGGLSGQPISITTVSGLVSSGSEILGTPPGHGGCTRPFGLRERCPQRPGQDGRLAWERSGGCRHCRASRLQKRPRPGSPADESPSPASGLHTAF